MKNYWKSKAIVALMLLSTWVCITGCVFEDDPFNPSNDAYVDLGLPSGTLWATCNLGAEAPEQYGDYFAWGETESKTTYNWSTYKYSYGDSNVELLTKYCNSADFGYNGFTDNLTRLEPTDDAATVILGNDWCMPTYDQWKELYEHTSWDWTSKKGTKGILFTADNGNTLFLPAAGGRYDDNLFYFNVEGLYWSSELYVVSSVSYFNFNMDFCSMKYGPHRTGYSVRPVRSTH